MTFQELWPSARMDLQIAGPGSTSFPQDCKDIYSTEHKTGCPPFERQTYLLNIDCWFLWLWSCNFFYESLLQDNAEVLNHYPSMISKMVPNLWCYDITYDVRKSDIKYLRCTWVGKFITLWDKTTSPTTVKVQEQKANHAASWEVGNNRRKSQERLSSCDPGSTPSIWFKLETWFREHYLFFCFFCFSQMHWHI